MRKRKRTPRRKRTAPENRARRSPLQVYLSADELRAFRAMCERHGLSAAELVRRWIARADAGVRGARSRTRPQTDPRQLDVADLLLTTTHGDATNA